MVTLLRNHLVSFPRNRCPLSHGIIWSTSPEYTAEDIDEIFLAHLGHYLGGIDHEEFVRQSDAQLSEKRRLLEYTQKERGRLAKRMNDLLPLRLDGEITGETFTRAARAY